MRFIHTADLHLGAVPDIGYPWSDSRQKEIWDTFGRLIDVVREGQIDLLLIVGDVFHNQPLLREIKELNYLFSTIPDTQVVITAGNHDYLRGDSRYRSFEWEPNVTFIDSEMLKSATYSALGVRVSGFSYQQREMVNMPSLEPAEPFDGTDILMLHGGDGKHLPFTCKDLTGLPYDYIALGHIHKAQTWEENRIAYSGSLEPLDKNDLGAHGYIRGTVTDDGDVQTDFVPFAKRSYHHEEICINAEATALSVADGIRERLLEFPPDDIFKLTLVGMRDASLSFENNHFDTLGNIIEIIDETKPDYDIEKIRQQYAGTLIAKYINSFPAQGERSEIEEQALYAGLTALMEAREQA